MTKWRFFLCKCGKYFRVRPGIEQRELTCPKCGKFAHNGIRFDRLFMNAELGRVGLKQLQPEQFIDSAAIFKAWRMDILDWLNNKTFFEFANKVLEKRAYGVYFNLNFCCETLAINTSDLKAHRAGADVVMTYRVIEALRKLLLNEM